MSESGLAGMSAGFLPDLQYSTIRLRDFKPRLRANARAFLKDRYDARDATASPEPIAPSGPASLRVTYLRISRNVGRASCLTYNSRSIRLEISNRGRARTRGLP